jgi:hypothetical protein
VENCELIFRKAKEFSDKHNFDIKFLFETKLAIILENSIREQQNILTEASLQRSKLEREDSTANNEQNRLMQIDKLIKDIETLALFERFTKDDLNLLRQCTSSCIQFCRGVINFFSSILLIYYQDINYSIVDAISKLFKGELKIMQIQINSSQLIKLSKEDMYNNVCFVEKVFKLIEDLYNEKASVSTKYFSKITERFAAFKEENFKR